MTDDFWRKVFESMNGPMEPGGIAELYAAPVSSTQNEDGTWIVRKAGMVGVGATKHEALEDVWKKVKLHLLHRK